MPSAFDLGARYSRAEISARLGGSLFSYLPFRDGQVVAACLSPAYNPDAPRSIYVGDGPDVQKAADLFERSGEAAPTFLRRDAHAWEYVGEYRVSGSSTDPETLRAANRHAGRDDVVRVLYLDAKG